VRLGFGINTLFRTPRWRITRIRSTPAVEIGTVEAPDAASAIEEAMCGERPDYPP
jgi:hypothetical protein